MRRLFTRYINGSHIICLRTASSNTQVIRNYCPQSQGTAGTLISWPRVPGMTLYQQRKCTAGAWLQMAGAHIYFRLYALVICDHAPAQRNVEDLDFVSAVPHSNHHTMGTASWQNHDSSPSQSVIKLHCYVCLNRSIKPLHFLRIVEAM